nr:MAG TPA: Baseplate component [Caudoviricetes sp.]
MEIKNYIHIDFTRGKDIVVPSIQYDSGTRWVMAKLYDNGLPIDLKELKVCIMAVKSDGKEVFNECKIIDAEKGIIEFEITKQMGILVGEVECQIKLFGPDQLLSSNIFKLSVTKTLSPSSESSKDELDVLVNALGEVQNIDNRFAQINAQLSHIANTGTTIEAVQNKVQDMAEKGLIQAYTIGDNSISQKKINSDYDKNDTIIALNNVVENGSFYYSSGKIIFNVNDDSNYKRMVIDTFSIEGDKLVIPYNPNENKLFSATMSGSVNKDGTDTANYNLSWQNVKDNIWGSYYGEYISGNYFFTLDIKKLKTNQSNYRYLFVTMGVFDNYENPYCFIQGKEEKKNLQWLEVKKENLSSDVLELLNKDFNNTDLFSLYFDKGIAIGDSLTEGDLAGTEYFKIGNYNYPYFLSKMLRAEITNAGKSGFTTQQWYQNEFSKYNYMDYDFAIIFLGTNGGLQDTISGANTNDQTGYYCSIIEGMKAQNPNIKIILIGNVQSYYTGLIKKIGQYYNIPVLDVYYGQDYFNIKRVSGEDATIAHPHDTDWVHFGSIGYLMLAIIIYKMLNEEILTNYQYYEYL